MRPGWLCVLAGEPSHGKTAAALTIAEHALKDNKSVLLVSLEMGEEEVAVRFAQHHGFNSNRYYEGGMTETDGQILDHVRANPWWSNLHIERVERVGQIALLVRRWKPDLLIIDHLQLLAGAEQVATLSQNTRSLKLLAEQFKIPVLCLSQLNRQSFEEKGALPRLSRLRGSGTIEQDADTVVFVWRKRDENEKLTDEGAFITAKSRMGRIGSVRTRWDGERQTFTVVTGTPQGGTD
jgi:replicative DNA helicase